ncbi:cytidine deaminase [Erwinia psidii]|uniref:Cytidine deaminase n=1 Tax=Erwinia psidii TaxID=69224 RepID=A0A3N6UV48_9GAMM|nr:cytidine deaminase [Erwinia psidii]MCX8956500.1 cytidine deaminase [Erwinia psidii]MCX8962346.1 cytidine deaminase [Erwinia psidii]MCX8965893.1 cytidine deaminase [Erwinia psidii]RQM39829.1 cytidine deaminase [Erwinia psidii]
MQPRFQTAFNTLPPLLQAAVAPCLHADDFQAFFTPDQVAAMKNHSGLDLRELMFALLPLAAACAVTPLSGFNVGAIAQGNSGHLWLGANMEFSGAAMQQTVHAEQSAITHAWLRGETGLTAIAVNYTPCGHCRQFMNELNSATTLAIHLPGRAPAVLADYLPDAFGPRDLDIQTLLLDPVDHRLNITGDPLCQAALRAANRSHAPYSQALSGVALQSRDGAIFFGSYAENAAFNPSLPPLQAALILLNLSGYDIKDIQRAVLAEAPDAKLTQRHATEATLKALGCHNITTIPLL